MTGQPIDPFSFFPDSIIEFRDRDYLLESLIEEPKLDYFELGKFLANLPFLADCGHSDSEGITRFLKSVKWGEGLDTHLNQINDVNYLDSVASSRDARIAYHILVSEKNSQNSWERKHEKLMDLAVLEIAYKDYYEGYKTFLRGLRSDYEENQVLVPEPIEPNDSDWSELNQALWNRSELFWASCMAAVQNSFSNAKYIGWFLEPGRKEFFSFGNSWFVIFDRDEEAYQVVPPTSDLLVEIGFYSGEDCVWFRDFERCEMDHNHDNVRVLFLDAPAPVEQKN